MAIDYKTLHEQITAAVKDHLIEADALPPNSEVPKLAREITQVVFTELKRSGFTEEAFNRLAAIAPRRAMAQGRA